MFLEVWHAQHQSPVLINSTQIDVVVRAEYGCDIYVRGYEEPIPVTDDLRSILDELRSFHE